MHKEEFFEEVKNAVLQKIKECDSSLDAAINEVMKNNGIVYHGLTFRGKDNIQPVIYLDEFYSKYSGGIDFEEIVDTVADMYFLSRKNKDFDVSILSSFDMANKHITAAVMNAELNAELLREMPHRKFEDLALFYRVEFDFTDESGYGAVKITNALMNTWGITEEEIYQVAIENTMIKYKPVCRDMLDIVQDMMPDDFDYEEPVADTGMLVLTNDKTSNGAVLIYPAFAQLEKIANIVNDDLYVLPSSRSELILLRASDVSDVDFLREMVTEVNSTNVPDEDVLSNNVYYFRRLENTLKIA